MEKRLFDLTKMAKFDTNEPQKVMVYKSEHTIAGMWCLEPGQEVFLHVHPNADDVWVCLEGESGSYFVGEGKEVPISKGMVVLAEPGQPHGMRNTGNDRFVFIGFAAPISIETERLDK
ncbi:cupin domain-containing protein [Dehalobacterium formicoaceticum]|uniref:Cupin domain-containing protein n=1 Tax=Dehalobacterium formicoaceticum TaxID=51515 RepID=A0ABT1Y4Y1_9FIRM|nr:cupin domain-containing protein [Dehalobacterium formicoaceticum]MCR6544974.1 cupin domain-containing protein [Dehalobacterium formicoaceticum]